MAQTYLSRFLAAMRQAEQQLSALFDALAAFAASEVLRAAGPEGIIPTSAIESLQLAIGARITQTFLGRTAGGGRAPFILLPDGTVYPLSPYARILLRNVDEVERLAIAQQQAIMQRAFEARGAPFTQVRLSSPLFSPNPLAQYERAHTWVDPNGYRLSERIWRTTGNTRRKLDMFLEENIAQGRGARAMAGDLETFLRPGRRLIRTKRPYGTDASFDAMRLARTEITRAHAKAQENAGELNPFVTGVEVVLSLSHPKPDICDEAAAAGPFPLGEIPAQYQIPLHPHCMCHYRNVITGDIDEVIAQERAKIGAVA